MTNEASLVRVNRDKFYAEYPVKFTVSGQWDTETHTRAPDEVFEGSVSVEIDLAQVVRKLGRAAMLNKTGKSVDGPIAVKRLKKK